MYNQTISQGEDYFQKMVDDLEKRKKEIQIKFEQKNRELIDLQNQHKNDHLLFKESINDEIKERAENDKRIFINSQEKQDQKLTDLYQNMNQMKIMEQNYYQNVQNIKSLRSISNPSRLILVQPVDQKEFLINLNNKCLTVQDQYNYHLEPCSYNNPSQRFVKDSVYDMPSFLKVYPDTNEVPSKIDPFNLVYSKITGSCLTEENNGISLQECQKMFSQINNSQKWKPESLAPRC